jgi:hypothetical protein
MARRLRKPIPRSSCATCTRPPGAGFVLCSGCIDRLADHLSVIPALSQELDVTLARWDVLYVAAGRGGEEGLPFAQEASASQRALCATVLRWASQVATTHGTLWVLPNSLAEMVAWLTHRLDWLRRMESAAQAYIEMDTAVARARRAIDRPVHRTSFPVGPCPEIIDTRYCLGIVVAYIPIRIGVEPALLRCRNPECVRNTDPWPPEEWRSAGRRILRRRAGLDTMRSAAPLGSYRCPGVSER